MKKISKVLAIASITSILSCTTQVVSNKVDTKKEDANVSMLKAIKTINVGKTPHGIASTENFVYNSDTGENTISVIDNKTDEVVKKITLDSGVAGYVKGFLAHKYLAAFDTKQKKLNLIDPTQDQKIVQSIDLIGIPDKIVFSGDEKSAVMSFPNEEKFGLINIDSDLTKKIEVKYFDTGKASKDAESRAIDFRNNLVLTTNYGDNDVTLFDITKNTVKKLKDGNTPTTVNLTERKAIVGNKASNTVTVFDLDSDKKATISDIGLSPTDAVVVEDLKEVFVTMAGSDEVAVIDYENAKLVKKIAVGKRPVHIYVKPHDTSFTTKHDGDTAEIWVANDNGESVSVIDTVELTVKATIQVGKGHHKIAFSNSKVYVSNISDNTVSVIDPSKIK